MNSDVSEIHSCANLHRNKPQMEPYRGNPGIIHFSFQNHILCPKYIFGQNCTFVPFLLQNHILGPKSIWGPKLHFWAQNAFLTKIALLGPKCMLGTQMLPGRKAGEHFGATPLPPVTPVAERVRNAFLRQPPPKQASDGATSGEFRNQ